MDLAQQWIEADKIGKPIFLKLFEMKKEKLIKVLKEILQNHPAPLRIFEYGDPGVVKTIKNDYPEKIEMYHYDCVIISSTGISYKAEHRNEVPVLKFDKFFSLEDLI